MGWLCWLGVPSGAVIVVGGLAGMTTDGGVDVVVGLAAIALSPMLANGFFRGQAWARRFYLWGMPLAAATEVVLESNLLTRQGFSVWKFAIEAVFYAISLFLLTRPKARAFFDRATPAAE